MNYEESNVILEEIKKSESFVLFCHENPDFDSIISCLLLGRVLERMSKKVDIFSPEDIGLHNKFIDKDKKIKVIDPNKVNYSNYDVFFALDVNEISRFGLYENFKFTGKIINIDHHEGNRCGELSIFDRDTAATSSLLYLIFKDWGVKLTIEDLQLVLLGLISDSNVFQFSIYKTTKAFKIVSELMELGVDYEEALFHVSRCNSIEIFQFISEAIKDVKIDRENQFAYTLISKEVFSKYKPYGVRSRLISDNFLRNLNDTNFGIVMIEEDAGKVKVSVRTRTPGYYVLDYVKSMGGGGHLTGGGATVIAGSGKTEDAVNDILKKARDFTRIRKETHNEKI